MSLYEIRTIEFGPKHTMRIVCSFDDEGDYHGVTTISSTFPGGGLIEDWLVFFNGFLVSIEHCRIINGESESTFVNCAGHSIKNGEILVLYHMKMQGYDKFQSHITSDNTSTFDFDPRFICKVPDETNRVANELINCRVRVAYCA